MYILFTIFLYVLNFQSTGEVYQNFSDIKNDTYSKYSEYGAFSNNSLSLDVSAAEISEIIEYTSSEAESQLRLFEKVLIIAFSMLFIFFALVLILLIRASRKNRDLYDEITEQKKALESILSEKQQLLDKNMKVVEDLSNYKTELEYQNEELAESQHKMEIIKNQYYEIYNFAPIAYFTLDENFKILEANQKAEEIFNFPKKEMINKYFFDFFEEESKNIFHFFKESITDDIIKTKEISIDSGNEIKNTVMDFKMFYDERAKRRVIYAVCSDITQKKKLENELLNLYRDLDELVAQRTISLQNTLEEKHKTEIELKDKERFIVNFTKKLPVGVYRTTPEGKVVFANDRLIQILGYKSIQEFRNEFVTDLFVHRDARKKLIKNLSLGKNTFESKLKRKDGSEIWVKDTSSIEYDKDGNVAYFDGIIEDITQKKIDDDNLKKAFEQLNETKEKLEEANRLKAIILGNLGHELRTPLNGILGFTQLLIEDTEDEEAKEMLDMIYESASRLHKTLNSLLSITELESNYSNVHFDLVELDMLTDSILNQFRSQIERKSLELILDINNEYQVVYSDEFLLTQIIFNVIDNAVKFTHSGSIKISLDIYEDNLNFVVLEIIDTGIGISKDKLDNIFEAFRQESEGVDRKFEGIGIGLTITKKLVEMLHCKIEIISELEKGTTVRLFIPKDESAINKLKAEK